MSLDMLGSAVVSSGRKYWQKIFTALPKIFVCRHDGGAAEQHGARLRVQPGGAPRVLAAPSRHVHVPGGCLHYLKHLHLEYLLELETIFREVLQ